MNEQIQKKPRLHQSVQAIEMENENKEEKKLSTLESNRNNLTVKKEDKEEWKIEEDEKLASFARRNGFDEITFVRDLKMVMSDEIFSTFPLKKQAICLNYRLYTKHSGFTEALAINVLKIFLETKQEKKLVSFAKSNGFDEISFVHDVKDFMSKFMSHRDFSTFTLQEQALCLYGHLSLTEHSGITKALATNVLKIFYEDSSAYCDQRGPRITDGLETKLVHQLDFSAFEERVTNLFKWHTNSNISRRFLAPYFAIVQSSGMGKTKLFVEYRDKCKDSSLTCKMILCRDAKLPNDQESRYFDDRVCFETHESYPEDKVREKMNNIVKGITGRIVLLFDEAQGLMKGFCYKGKRNHVFRIIRYWLREQRECEIVAVFAGTTVALANLFPPDPPPAGASRNSRIEYKNYKEEDQDPDMKKLYPPFYELNTIACLRKNNLVSSTGTNTTDKTEAVEPGYPNALIYGRPLFAHYYLKEELDDQKLKEFADRLILSEAKYEDNISSCYSVLGSRVQMGVVSSFHTLSALVSSGYACLVDFRQQIERTSFPFLGVTFMPDPLCATLAMRFMDKDWGNGTHKGKDKNFWVEQAKEAFNSKMCRPDKGDASEIFAALYLLFCGDVIRKEKDATLSSFVVSLEEWFFLVCNGGKRSSGTIEQDMGGGASGSLVSSAENFLENLVNGCTTQSKAKQNELKMKTTEAKSTVSFIQICRNDFRSNSFCDREKLEYMYLSGLGSYAYKNCKAFDISLSIKVTEGSETSFHPLLVSVKKWTHVSKADIVGWLSSMMLFLSDMREGRQDKPSAVCLIVLLGCSDPPMIVGDDLNSQNLNPFPFMDVFRLVCVDDDDDFGISTAVRNLDFGSEESEIYSSHAFMGCETSWENLLRASSKNKDKVSKLFSALKLSADDAIE